MYLGWQWKRIYDLLSLEILADLLRLVFAIDPLGIISLFDPFSAVFWLTHNAAVSIISHIMVLTYRNRALTTFGAKSVAWLEKYVNVLFGVICVFKLISPSLRALNISGILCTIMESFYGSISVFEGICRLDLV